MFSDEQIKLFKVIQQAGEAKGVNIFIVGGILRDIFLGQEPGDKDIDFIVEGNAIEFADSLLKTCSGELKKFNEFYTAKIVSPGSFASIREIDFASSRSETYEKPGSLPTVSLAPIKEDLKRRDFSINAMAVKLSDLLAWELKPDASLAELRLVTLDFFEGFADLEKRIVRILHPQSFEDDPTRIFRAARYASRIAGSIEAKTEEAAIQAVGAGCLSTISDRRKLNEIRKIIAEKEIGEALSFLERIGVFERMRLYMPSRHDEVVELIQLIRSGWEMDEELFYQSVVRVFFYCSYGNDADKKDAEEAYSVLGFGSNEIKKLSYDTRNDLDLVQRQSLQRLSKSGLIVQAAINRDRPIGGLLKYAEEQALLQKPLPK